MALVLPVMLAITIGFIGVMLEVRAQMELQTAVDLAAQSSIVPPRPPSCRPGTSTCPDPASLNLQDARYAFAHTLDASGGEAPYLEMTSPLQCTGPYLEGQVPSGPPQPVLCTAGAVLDFSRTPIGLLWFARVGLQATAQAVPATYRQCQALTGGGPC
jgi:hypothetical protein